jgi:hypothetical protein
LMNAFCDRQGKAPATVRFVFEGQRVQPTDTPDAVRFSAPTPPHLPVTSLLTLAFPYSSRWRTATHSRCTKSRLEDTDWRRQQPRLKRMVCARLRRQGVFSYGSSHWSWSSRVDSRRKGL